MTPPDRLPQQGKPELARNLTLVHATLYGLGVTIGAGIYVLVGAAAGRSGMFAPSAFAIAALVMSLTAASFAELVGRAPVAAGEAAYVKLAFNSTRTATVIGLCVVGIAIISAAAISVGAAGYLAEFITLPPAMLIAAVVLSMMAIAAWGIKESVIFASILTLIEITGLLVVVISGFWTQPEIISRMPEIIPQFHVSGTMAALLSTTLLAVFAFIGFESLANVAEEVRDPRRTLPRAILLTVLISAVLYMLVVWVALVAVPLPELTRSAAPLALVFERLTGASPRLMSAVAVLATLNGVVVQMIMASRVLYGLGHEGQLPAAFASVNPTTQTPLIATISAAVLILLFAEFLPLDRLADLTSRLTLGVFAVVNLALIRIKWRGDAPTDGGYVTATWVPWAGCLSCIVLLVAEFIAK
jgi:amino acid transporter